MNGAVSQTDYDRVRGFLLHLERERPEEIATEEFFSFLNDLAKALPNPPKASSDMPGNTLMFCLGGLAGCVGMAIVSLFLG